jgi:hypothetical protein
MNTTDNIPEPIRHLYKEINTGISKTEKYYTFIESTNGKPILTDLLSINLDPNHPTSWAKIYLNKKPENSWERITSLCNSFYLNCFFGSTEMKNKRKDLILCRLSKDQSIMLVYYFPNFSTRSTKKVIHSINK